MHPYLVASVGVEVERFGSQTLTSTKLTFGAREIQPDRLAQVREVESAEHSVPHRVVALRMADGAARSRRIAPTAAERGERHHLLVRAVRLRVLDEKVAPVRAAHEYTVALGEALGTQLRLERGEPVGGRR